MPDVSFSGIVVVSAVAFAAPFVLGLFPRLRFPAVVVEIVLGILLGPSVLGWVHADLVIRVLAVVDSGSCCSSPASRSSSATSGGPGSASLRWGCPSPS